jgi:hypothetical protein
MLEGLYLEIWQIRLQLLKAPFLLRRGAYFLYTIWYMVITMEKLSEHNRHPLSPSIARDMLQMYIGVQQNESGTSQLWRAEVAKELVKRGINNREVLRAFITGNSTDIEQIQRQQQPKRTTIPQPWQPPTAEARNNNTRDLWKR